MRTVANNADIVIRIPADPKQREMQNLDEALRQLGAWALKIHAMVSALAVGSVVVALGVGCLRSLARGVQP